MTTEEAWELKMLGKYCPKEGKTIGDLKMTKEQLSAYTKLSGDLFKFVEEHFNILSSEDIIEINKFGFKYTTKVQSHITGLKTNE